MSSKKSEKNQAEQGIQQAGAGITAAAAMTPEETTQYTSSFEIGKLLEQIMKYQQGLGAAPSEYLGPEQQYLRGAGELGKAYYGQTLRGVQDPYAAYESQLQPSLQLTEDYINRAYQGRGLLRSGLPIEQMGRAGVELAIKEAQDRMNFRGQELARGGELTQYTQGYGQQNLANLANIYGQQQGYGQAAKGRQVQGAVQAAAYQAYPYQMQLGSTYSKQGQLGGGIGGLVGGGVGLLASGGNPYAGMIGYGAGSNLGRSFF